MANIKPSNVLWYYVPQEDGSLIRSFRVGDVVHVDLIDVSLDPEQWIEAKIKTVVHDGFYLDIPDVIILDASQNAFFVTAECKVFYGAVTHSWHMLGGFLDSDKGSDFAHTYDVHVWVFN